MLNILRSVISIVMVVAFMALTVTAQQDRSFITPDGQSINLSNMRGKVVILLFGGIQDPQCRDEFKALESLAERYQNKDVKIYWVSVNSPTEANNEKLKSPCGPAGSVIVLRDQNQSAFKSYSGRQLPTIVVLNQQGEVHGQARGGFNPNSDFINDMAAIIDSLLSRK